jgi:hypothetical protein
MIFLTSKKVYIKFHVRVIEITKHILLVMMNNILNYILHINYNTFVN